MPTVTEHPSVEQLQAFGLGQLSPAEQAHAVVAAGRYASAFTAKPTTHPISPVRFLRERCFEGYGPAAASAMTLRPHRKSHQHPRHSAVGRGRCVEPGRKVARAGATLVAH